MIKSMVALKNIASEICNKNNTIPNNVFFICYMILVKNSDSKPAPMPKIKVIAMIIKGTFTPPNFSFVNTNVNNPNDGAVKTIAAIAPFEKPKFNRIVPNKISNSTGIDNNVPINEIITMMKT